MVNTMEHKTKQKEKKREEDDDEEVKEESRRRMRRRQIMIKRKRRRGRRSRRNRTMMVMMLKMNKRRPDVLTACTDDQTCQNLPSPKNPSISGLLHASGTHIPHVSFSRIPRVFWKSDKQQSCIKTIITYRLLQ